jgi:carboxylate-amine ligase
LTDRPFQPGEDDYLVYTFNRFEACRFGLQGAYIDPQSNKRQMLRQHIQDTLERIFPYAEQLGAQAAGEMINHITTAGVNDAVWLREVNMREKSLNEMVRQQCLVWREAKVG